MQKNKKRKAFTLTELLVVIAIIAIFALSMTRMNFNYMSGRQKSEMFANQIISLLETSRNDALIGRGISSEGNTLENPIAWKVSVSRSGISTQYNLQDGSSHDFNENTLELDSSKENGNIIKNIYCDETDISDGTGNIQFEGKNINITSDSGNCSKLVIDSVFNQDNRFQITFDSVNGLITKKYMK